MFCWLYERDGLMRTDDADPSLTRRLHIQGRPLLSPNQCFNFTSSSCIINNSACICDVFSHTNTHPAFVSWLLFDLVFNPQNLMGLLRHVTRAALIIFTLENQ